MTVAINVSVDYPMLQTVKLFSQWIIIYSQFASNLSKACRCSCRQNGRAWTRNHCYLQIHIVPHN